MLPAAPKAVYDAFMTSAKHAAFTGGEAVLSKKVGGAFETFDGWASGENIELTPGKLIVQSWRGSDWPAEHFSTLKIQLLPAPGGKTKLLMTQTDVPTSVAKDVAQGWKDYYWTPLGEYLTPKK